MGNLRFALRRLAASPGVTAIAVVTLALGVGLNTAMFSVLNTLLLRPLPFPEPHRLFRLDRTSAQQPDGSHRGPNYLDIERHSGEVADVGAGRSHRAHPGAEQPVAGTRDQQCGHDLRRCGSSARRLDNRVLPAGETRVAEHDSKDPSVGCLRRSVDACGQGKASRRYDAPMRRRPVMASSKA